jgi:hypothetical protein
MLLISVVGFCQAPHKVYCEIVGTGNLSGSKISKVEVDMGQTSKQWSSKNRVLVNDQNEKIEFNSMMDAVNYFSKLGWNFVQAYAIAETQGMSRETVYHYILVKEVSKDEQAVEGIKLKE